MAKKKYQLYLEEDDTEFVKEFLNACKLQGGLSGYVGGYMKTTAKTLRASGWKPGKELTYAKAMKIALNGVTQSPA